MLTLEHPTAHLPKGVSKAAKTNCNFEGASFSLLFSK